MNVNKSNKSESIFDFERGAKAKADKTLTLARSQESEKLKDGWKYVVSADGKTRTLKRVL